MKTTNNTTANHSITDNHKAHLYLSSPWRPNKIQHKITQSRILTPFKRFANKLFSELQNNKVGGSALEFAPYMAQLPRTNFSKLKQLFKPGESSSVLMDNDFMKVILIYWPKGKSTDIHGHPKGGGIIKILAGKLKENRYTASSKPQLLASSTYHKNSMTYIDDQLAYHTVENPFNEPSLSFHVYMK